MLTDTRLTDRISSLDPQRIALLSETDRHIQAQLLERLYLDDRVSTRRRASHRRVWAFGGVAVACCVAAAALFVTAQPHPATANFALSASGALEGWSATAEATEATTADTDACVRVAVPEGTPASPVSVLTSEVRGRFTTLFMSIASQQGYCILLGGEAVWMPGGSFTSDDLLDPSPAPNDVTTDWNGISDDNTHVGLIVTAHGRAGAQVAAVTVTLADGSRVDATVANGSWSAWWPSTGDPGIASQLTAILTMTVTFTTADGASHTATQNDYPMGDAARQIQIARDLPTAGDEH